VATGVPIRIKRGAEHDGHRESGTEGGDSADDERPPAVGVDIFVAELI
jgi:hypothetical protein